MALACSCLHAAISLALALAAVYLALASMFISLIFFSLLVPWALARSLEVVVADKAVPFTVRAVIAGLA